MKFLTLTSLFSFPGLAWSVEFKKTESAPAPATLATESAEAKTAASETHYFYICKNQKTVRTLRMDKKSANCQAVYTKDGVDKVIGAAQKTSSCVDVLENVKKTLTTAGWKCKEVKGEQITSKTDIPLETKIESQKK